jgi:hypothetical protein
VKKINKIQALKIVRKNGLRLKELPSIFKKDKDVVLAAVKNDGFAIADADKSFLRDKKIAIEAIKNNKHSFLLFFNTNLIKDKDILNLVGIKNS